MRIDRVTAFLAVVLRRSWPSVAAIPLAIRVDQDWGTCVPSAGPAGLVAVLLLLLAAVITVRALVRDRHAATLAGAGVNLYAFVVAWVLLTA